MKLPNIQLAVVEREKIVETSGVFSATDHGVSSGGFMIKERDCVVLTEDLPGESLQAGDVGAVVHVHREGAAYEVEFVTLTGQTVAVATVLAAQLRPIGRRDISHVRELTSA